MKYITCKTTHYTGEVFVDAMKIADNEVYAIVEADNLERAREIARSKRYCPICNDCGHVISEWKYEGRD